MPTLRPDLPRLLGRFGLAFCFFSIGVWEIFQPLYWAGYVPSPILEMTDPGWFVRIHGVVLVAIALGVLFGRRKVFLFAGAAVFMMLSILGGLIMHSGFSEIFIRDVAILFLAAMVFTDAMILVQKTPPQGGGV